MSYRTASKKILRVRGRNRSRRPKTFKTEEAAKFFAEKQKFKKYQLINLRNPESATKKIRIVVEE